MRGRVLIPLLVLLALPSAGTRAPAQEKAPAKARLGLPDTAVGRIFYIHSLETVQDLVTVEQPLRITSTTDLEFSIEAGPHPPKWERTGKLRFGRCRLRCDNPMLGKVDYTTGSPIPESGIARMVALGIAGLDGSDFPVDLGDGGDVLCIRDFDDVVRRRAEKIGFSDEDVRAVGRLTSERTVIQLVNGALAATPLPRGEYPEGHSWREANFVPGTHDIDILLIQEFRLARIGDEEVLIEGCGRVDASSSNGGFKSDASGNVAKEGQVSSRVRVSRRDGLPLAATVESSLKFEVESKKTTIKQTMKGTLERVDAWPSRRPVEKDPAPK